MPPVGQIRDEALLNRVVLKLKQLRNEKGLSQERVYLDTDIHIGRIEAEKVNVSISTLKKLCDYYGISLATFFQEID